MAREGWPRGERGSRADRLAQLSPRPPDVISLADRLERPHDRLTPYVVSRPPWLVGAGTPPAAPPWRLRKLLFMSGHVPKLITSSVRYLLWKALHDSPVATTLSSTIGCNIGA